VEAIRYNVASPPPFRPDPLTWKGLREGPGALEAEISMYELYGFGEGVAQGAGVAAGADGP